jgi:PhnB protein
MADAYVPPDPPVVPYLMVHDGAAALDWYERALGATVELRYDEADGRVGHATLAVNDGVIYLADEFPEAQDRIGAAAPRTLGSTTVSISLAVDDVDAWTARAVAEGALVIRPAGDEFYGRHAKLTDPYGHVWSFIGPKTAA